MRSAFAASLVLLAACAAHDPGVAPETERGGGRAALAVITLENRTPHDVTVSYEHAVGPANRVTLGVVEAGATRTLTPLPAGEPIVLTLTEPAGRTYALPPRTLPIGGEWHWIVQAETRFDWPEAEP